MKRTRLARELLSTEQTYVESIDILVKVFIVPLQGKQSLSPSLAEMFRNVQVIAGLNKKFLDELSVRMVQWDDTQKIGDVFLAFAPFLRMYCSYANQHEDGTRVLQQMRQNRDSLVKLINEFAQSPECKGNGLESFLILPVQRLPRYRMLFHELSSITDPSHPDYDDLKSACQQASNVTTQINEAIRDRENSAKILELQKRFNNEVTLVAPSRRLVRVGSLTKVCRSKNMVREFILFNDLLVYARPASGRSDGLKLNRMMSVDASFEVIDEPSSEGRYPFQIRSQEKSFTVLADSHEDKVEWLIHLTECIQEFKNRTTKTRAMSVVMDAAPVWQPNSLSNSCSVCFAEFSMFRRRHHCRRCGCLVCGDCSRGRIALNVSDSGKTQRMYAGASRLISFRR
ncbi:hypothetical protein PBRA_001881 [Plasmodiophora brassicae]|uniref:FYVE-type domain-containing protein n=1 Tax=Plasmodiophora brassicae TaxID=37360 RepID=A0A0G4J141_PLABS|nr:hypothetical protein PBRA_001881 [Plasmodiophora brassicae]